jgi:hypothetical protein
MTYAIHQLKGLPIVEESRRVTPKNIKYGMMVEVLNYNDGGYHSGCKVHFWNRKGVLVGNYYEFMPYERLRMIARKDCRYPRYFMGKNYLRAKHPIGERLKMWAFIRLCNLITALINFTQPIID